MQENRKVEKKKPIYGCVHIQEMDHYLGAIANLKEVLLILINYISIKNVIRTYYIFPDSVYFKMYFSVILTKNYCT